MKPGGPGAEEGETADQDDTGLRAGTDDGADPVQIAREALAEEARQQATHQPVFEVDLHHIGGVDSGLRIARRFEGDGFQWRRRPPTLSVAPSGRGGARANRRAPPASRHAKHGSGGIEPEQLGAADLADLRSVERAAGPRQRRATTAFSSEVSTPTRLREASSNCRMRSSSRASRWMRRSS